MHTKRTLGGSGHVNVQDYRGGVLIGNWYEDAEAARAGDRTASTLMGFGGPFEGTSTHRATFTAGGQVPYERRDLGARENCVPPQLKFSHGDPQAPPVQCFATVNQLTLGEHFQGEPKVQQYLWTGQNRHDAEVPRTTLGREGGLASSKRANWQGQFADHDMYTTTSKAAAQATAIAQATLRCTR